MKRYEIRWTALDPAQGSEMAKTRPAVIVSLDVLNRNLNTVTVCPLTSQLHPTWRSRLQVRCGGRPAEVAVDQILRISRQTTALLALLFSLLTGGVAAFPRMPASRACEPSSTTSESTELLSARRYTYTDLGVLGTPAGGPESGAAWSIDNDGRVVGASTTTLFGASHAFLWQDGALFDLGTLSSSPFGASAAYGINDTGTIVGQTNVDPDSEPPHAFRYRNGAMHDLGTGLGPGSFSRAWDINTIGQVVGERSRTQSSPVRAFLVRNGRFRDLGTLGGRSLLPFSVESIAYAINDRGQIVGTALPPDPPLHAFLWEDGVMLDLGTLGGNSEATQAYALNDRGHLVGASPTASGQIHAFLWLADSMQDLGTLGGNSSSAYGINLHGFVVGSSRTPTSPSFNAGHAFLWKGGQMVDLNGMVSNLPPDVVLEVARAISDDGSIVGTTCTSFCDPGATAPTHGYLLTLE